jgi:hypothetical protein
LINLFYRDNNDSREGGARIEIEKDKESKREV